MPKEFYVGSEIETLKTVLLHRPDASFNRLNHQNVKEFLFDDVPDLKLASEEHDYFANALKENNVEVLYFQKLLEETLSIPSARQHLIDKIITADKTCDAELKMLLSSLSLKRLLHALMMGITKNDLKNKVDTDIPLFDDYVLLPLPNQIYMRDSSSWLYNGIIHCNMASSARAREIINVETIYKFHPMFQHASHLFFNQSNSNEFLYTIEGGDILLLGKKRMIIGLSQRTNINSVQALVKALLSRKLMDSVIVVALPLQRRFMHLDTMMTMIDEDAFIIFEDVVSSLKGWLIDSGNIDFQLENEPKAYFLELLKDLLAIKNLRLFSLDSSKAWNEQWNDATNLLTVKPGLVIAYECNSETNKILTKGGIKVIEIPSKNLSKGRGGPRCLSCPLQRG